MTAYHWISFKGTDTGAFLVPWHEKASYPELAVWLLRQGAREIKEHFHWFEYLSIITMLLEDKIKVESLKYDLIGLAYRALVVAAPKLSGLDALLALLEDSDFNDMKERVISQISPPNKTDEMLNNGLDEIDGPYRFKSDNPYVLHCSFYQHDTGIGSSWFDAFRLIKQQLGAFILNYLMKGDYQIYYKVDTDTFWHQSVGKGVQSKGIIVKVISYLVFEDSIVTLTRITSSSYKSEKPISNEGVDVVIRSRDISNLNNMAAKLGIVLDFTTKTPLIVPFDKYKDKIFALSSFTHDCSEPFNPEDLLTRERVGILCHGEPGTGKTSFVYSLFYHLLRYQGYVFLNVGYEQYLEIQASQAVNIKAIILVNDADSIETENNRAKVLARLESNTLGHTITIFTVNNKDGLDNAFKRKGRIDYHLEFTKAMI